MNRLLLTRDGVPVLSFPLDRDVTAIGASGPVDLLVEHEDVAPLHAELDEWPEGTHQLTIHMGAGARSILRVVTPGSAFRVGPFLARYEGGTPRVRYDPPAWSKFWDSELGTSVECEGVAAACMESLVLLQRLQADRRHEEPWVVVGEAGTGKRRWAEALGRFQRDQGGVTALDCGTVEPRLVLVAAATGSARLAAVPGTDALDRPLLREAQRLPPIAQQQLACLTTPRVRLSFRRHPDRLAAEGRLVPQLHARLANVYVLKPLRERIDEVPPLFERLLRRFAPGEPPAVAPSAVAALRRHAWPGNVRELRNVVQRLLLRGAGPVIGEDDLRFDGLPN